MKKIYLILSLLVICVALNGQATRQLEAIGMENICSTEKEGTLFISFENNVYRGTYRGIGKAIEACLKSETKSNLQLLVLDNRIPQLCISLPSTLMNDYRKGEISLKQVYTQMEISVNTDSAVEALKEVKSIENPSAWKVDIVVYPELFLQNNSFDKLYRYAVNLSPAIEMGLWKGGKLTAQAVCPVATNLNGEYHKIHPGIIALSQEVRWKYNLFGRITAGNFTKNRMGVQLDMRYKTNNGRLELGALVGSTVYSGVVTGEGWYISTRQRINAAVKASVYEPHTNLQFDLQAERYVYGDVGVRGDCTRHFGEYAIGLYGIYTGGEINGGFHFAIPLPGKKWKRNTAVRIKPADYFAWTYGMVSHGKYVDEQMGKGYQVRADENRSSNFYQPDFIRYFLCREQGIGDLKKIDSIINQKTKK